MASGALGSDCSKILPCFTTGILCTVHIRKTRLKAIADGQALSKDRLRPATTRIRKVSQDHTRQRRAGQVNITHVSLGVVRAPPPSRVSSSRSRSLQIGAMRQTTLIITCDAPAKSMSVRNNFQAMDDTGNLPEEGVEACGQHWRKAAGQAEGAHAACAIVGPGNGSLPRPTTRLPDGHITAAASSSRAGLLLGCAH